METITHAVAGYAIAKSGLARDRGKWGIIAGLSAAVLPDADSLLTPLLGTEFMIQFHRSLTNSLFLALPFSLLLGWLFDRLSKMRRFWVFFTIGLVEVLAHTFMDLITSYGTMILSPLSYRRFTLDWVFIIDPWFTLALTLPLAASFIWKKRSQALARVALVLCASYTALCGVNHSWSLSLARTEATLRGLQPHQVASLPQPLSPFHWAHFIVTPDRIYEGFVDLIGKNGQLQNTHGGLLQRIWTRYQPITQMEYREWERFDESSWVDRALMLEGVKRFLNFARFPVGRYLGQFNGAHHVAFFDLRFGAIEGRRPFVYEVHFDVDGDVSFVGFARGSSSLP